jgi:hypothetical protein
LRLFNRFPFGLDSVTAVWSLLPGFSLRYLRTPAAVMPAPFFVDRKFFLERGGIFLPHLDLEHTMLYK